MSGALCSGGESGDAVAGVCDAGRTADIDHEIMKTIILFVAAALAACNSAHSNGNIDRIVEKSSTPTPAPVAQQPNDGVRRITTAELDDLMKQGGVVVVDVRNQQAYDLGHIRGAKLIPVGQVGERAKELPRDKLIVTYCS